MLALTSESHTPYHRLRAGPKLALLCVCAVALAGVVALYLVPGRAFLREGLRLLAPLWIFVALVVASHVAMGAALAGIVIGLRLLVAVALANLVTMTTLSKNWSTW